MKKYRWAKPLFVSLSIIIPLTIIVVMLANDIGALFNSWESQETKPDWRYVFLVLFKVTIYIFPPLIFMWGSYIENREQVVKNKFWYYFIKALNVYFLILLVIKLFSDTILELDSIWGFTIFNSIKDIQTLIGFIVTLLIRKNIEIKPGVDKIKAIERDENGFNDKNDGK